MPNVRAVPYLLSFPWLVIIAETSFYPISPAADISQYQTRHLEKTAFVCLAQYTCLLHGFELLRALRISLKLALGSPALTLAIGMIFALLFNRPIRFRATYWTLLIIQKRFAQGLTSGGIKGYSNGFAGSREIVHVRIPEPCHLPSR